MVHDQHPVCKLLHQGNIVADEQNGQALSLLGTEFIQQLDDLFLNSHIQGRGGLVTDQQLRLNGQGSGDGRPLALPAADLVGVAVRKFLWQAALFQEGFHPFPGLGFGYAGVS